MHDRYGGGCPGPRPWPRPNNSNNPCQPFQAGVLPVEKMGAGVTAVLGPGSVVGPRGSTDVLCNEKGVGWETGVGYMTGIPDILMHAKQKAVDSSAAWRSSAGYLPWLNCNCQHEQREQWGVVWWHKLTIGYPDILARQCAKAIASLLHVDGREVGWMVMGSRADAFFFCKNRMHGGLILPISTAPPTSRRL